MAAGKMNLQAADGAVIGLIVPNGLTSGERQISLGVNLSGITAYHLLEGNLSVSNEVITNGFSTTLYTGNGATQSINTGIDMSTQWGNDASETFGGLTWIKGRSGATSNYLMDTVRGATKNIYSNSLTAETTEATGLTAFTGTGFNIGALAGMNTSAATYASWNFQTTHRKTGTTNHGKAYTEHYNPFTGFTMIKYEGSGLAGHEIPHSLGRKLGFSTRKNLSSTTDWYNDCLPTGLNTYIQFNLSNAQGYDGLNTSTSDYYLSNSVSSLINANTNQYIMYGWANSYYDEADKLIGNYEVGIYQGTGAAGNKVNTRGKPAWVMIKRVDSTGFWAILDNQRGNGTLSLYANASNAEANDVNDCTVESSSFTLTGAGNDSNTSDGQYLYMVVYDNDSGSGKSKYPRATDSSQLQLNTALVPFANGIDSNGAKNTIIYKNETITGLTYIQGKNYVYCDKNGAYGRMSIAPNYGKVNPANGGDFYNVLTNKWFTSAGVEITNSRNYLNHIVHADNDGGVLYVEELPKIEYKDIIKANEFKGKNAKTGYVIADCSTTAPTIKDSYNIGAVIRNSIGNHRLYFAQRMDNLNYGWAYGSSAAAGYLAIEVARTLDYVDIVTFSITGANGNSTLLSIDFYGGKN